MKMTRQIDAPPSRPSLSCPPDGPGSLTNHNHTVAPTNYSPWRRRRGRRRWHKCLLPGTTLSSFLVCFCGGGGVCPARNVLLSGDQIVYCLCFLYTRRINLRRPYSLHRHCLPARLPACFIFISNVLSFSMIIMCRCG